jgi:hypothetical protein
MEVMRTGDAMVPLNGGWHSNGGGVVGSSSSALVVHGESSGQGEGAATRRVGSRDGLVRWCSVVAMTVWWPVATPVRSYGSRRGGTQPLGTGQSKKKHTRGGSHLRPRKAVTFWATSL